MIRVFSLLWTLILAAIVTGISFFYLRGELRGFPFSFANGTIDYNTGTRDFDFNFWLLGLDLIIWWLIFSILWIILKNYVFEV